MTSARAFAFALASLAVAVQSANACSKRWQFGPVLRENHAVILGTATADTMLAGSGGVRASRMFGGLIAVPSRPIYGQVISVDSSYGPGATSATRVVIVPWDYAADCRPMPYSGSAAWRPSGTKGLYTAELRDRSDWVRGVPTYDVHMPRLEPYVRPGGVGSRMPLSPEELFVVAKQLPTSYDDATGLLRFLQWARENPTIATRDPLPMTVASAQYAVRRLNLKALDVPMRGTYRVVASVGAADSVVFYARTDREPTTWHDPSDSAARLFSPPTDPIKAYALLVSLGQTISVIGRDERQQSYLYLPVGPASSSTGLQIWSGELQTDMTRLVFRTGPVVTAIAQLPAMVPASFTIDTKGAASFAHRSKLNDGRSVVIRGTRISMEAGR